MEEEDEEAQRKSQVKKKEDSSTNGKGQGKYCEMRSKVWRRMRVNIVMRKRKMCDKLEGISAVSHVSPRRPV